MKKLCAILTTCAITLSGTAFALEDFDVSTTVYENEDDIITVSSKGVNEDASWIVLQVNDGNGVPVYIGEMRPNGEDFVIKMDEDSTRTRNYEYKMQVSYIGRESESVIKTVSYYSYAEIHKTMERVLDGTVDLDGVINEVDLDNTINLVDDKVPDVLSIDVKGIYKKIDDNDAVVAEIDSIVGNRTLTHELFKEAYAKALMNVALGSKDDDILKGLVDEYPETVGVKIEGEYIDEMAWFNGGNKAEIIANVAKEEYDTPEDFLENFKYFCFIDCLSGLHSSQVISFLRINNGKYVDLDFEEFDSKLGSSTSKIDYAVDYIMDDDRDISTPEKFVAVFNKAIEKAKDYKQPVEDNDFGGGGSGGGGSANITIPYTPPTEVTVTPGASAGIFSDLGNNHWAKAEIEALYHKGIVNGRGDGRFDPDASITREEFVSIIVKAFGLTGTSDTVYGDVVSGAWYENAIMVATANEIVSGYDGMFGIGQNITREDMAVILYRIANKLGINISATIDREIIDKDSVSDYAYEASDALYKAGIINGMGSGMFEGKSNASRAQAAKLIYTMLNR